MIEWRRAIFAAAGLIEKKISSGITKGQNTFIMRILSLDTATQSCSVGVVEDKAVLAEVTLETGETHSRHLMNLIHQVMEISQVAMKDIDGFAVTRGPGSFTGLRIGISTVKGLAAASGKPMVGISALDALARQADGAAVLVCTVIDARKEEVYFARYRRNQGVLLREVEEQVVPITDAMADMDEPGFFIGNGARLYQSFIMDKLGEDKATFAPRFNHIIRASTVATMGIERFHNNDVDHASSFTPRYIRKSNAELNLSQRPGRAG